MSRLTFEFEYELSHLPWYRVFRRLYLNHKIRKIKKIHEQKPKENYDMKKILFAFAIAIAIALAFTSCCDSGPSGKYYVKDNGGQVWQTNEYQELDGCVTFTPTGKDEKPVKLCGGYAIQENSNYKPEEQKNDSLEE